MTTSSNRTPTRWNGHALADLIAKLEASAGERPGMGTDKRITVDVDRALWERLAVIRSVVDRERASTTVPTPPPDDETDGPTATVTRLRRKP
jgi:hypothetical protein